MASETRLCGNLELWFVYQSNLKCYLNVNISCLYQLPGAVSADALKESVRQALHKSVIPRNALLGCSIEDSHSNKPFFKRQVWQPDELPVIIEADGQSIEEIVVKAHTQQLPNAKPWQVHLLKAPSQAGSSYWIGFTFHHALADGMSGLIFHDQLFAALSRGTDASTPKEADFPIPPSIESCLDVRPTISMLLKEVWQLLPLPAAIVRRMAPASFLGNKTSIQQRATLKPGTRGVILPAESVTALRKLAKSEKVSVHALLHGAILHATAQAVPSNQPRTVTTATPINLRGVMEGHGATIGNYLSSHGSSVAPADSILETAKAFYKDLNRPAARRMALGLLGLLKFIDNHAPRDLKLAGHGSVDAQGCYTEDATSRHVAGMPQFILQRLERPSDTSLQATLEISNLGSWQPSPVQDGTCTITIEDIYFSGSSGPTGELLNVHVVTLTGGAMRIVFSYRISFIDEALVDQIVSASETNLLSLESLNTQ